MTWIPTVASVSLLLLILQSSDPMLSGAFGSAMMSQTLKLPSGLTTLLQLQTWFSRGKRPIVSLLVDTLALETPADMPCFAVEADDWRAEGMAFINQLGEELGH